MVPQFLIKEMQHDLLTREEEQSLAAKIQAGCEESRQKLFSANLKLVLEIVNSVCRFNMTELKNDAFNEGCIGLWIAAGHYKPNREAKFSSFAAWHIRGKILGFFRDKERAIRIPSQKFQTAQQIHKIELAFEERGEDKPSDEYLARELDKKIDVIKDIRRASFFKDPSICIGYEEEGEEEMMVRPEDSYEHKKIRLMDLSTKLQKAMVILTDKEKEVLSMRFGLNDDGAGLTLDKVGKTLNLTRERIRQIQDAAFCKIRNHFEANNIELPNFAAI